MIEVTGDDGDVVESAIVDFVESGLEVVDLLIVCVCASGGVGGVVQSAYVQVKRIQLRFDPKALKTWVIDGRGED